MKTTNKRKNILSVLVVLVMLMATLLTACGSNKAVAPSNDAETTKVETAQAEETEPTETTEVEEVAEVEPTAEPTPEDTKYAGIDMESTLPGLEWIATFDNIAVDEPIIVVYNDETNKKVIVQEGDEVEFSKSSDILAIYSPEPKTITIISIPGGFDESWEGGNELPDSVTSPRRIACQKGVNTSDSTQKCTFLAMLNGETKEYKFTLKFVE